MKSIYFSMEISQDKKEIKQYPYLKITFDHKLLELTTI